MVVVVQFFAAKQQSELEEVPTVVLDVVVPVALHMADSINQPA